MKTNQEMKAAIQVDVIILSYALVDKAEAKKAKTKTVYLDEKNHIRH